MTGWFKRVFGRKGPMNCRQVGAVLQEFLDGDIDADKAKRIEQHLEECRRCGLEAETYERIKATLAAQRPEVPEESIQRLRDFGERLARGEEQSSSGMV